MKIRRSEISKLSHTAREVTAEDRAARPSEKQGRHSEQSRQMQAEGASAASPGRTPEPPAPEATASTGSVYSNAFNFVSYQDAAVDLRTGQFSAVINLATIRPQESADGSRDIKLVFSALNTANAGYGVGWKIADSQFDPASRVLSLADGGTYTANPLPAPGNRVSFQDLKLQNLAVVVTDSSTLTIYYINGMIEVMRRQGSGPYRTVELIFENGETFAYSYAASGTLATIVNPTTGREVLKITCAFSALQKAQALVEGDRVAETFVISSNQLITQVTVPYDNTDGNANPAEQARFQYSYSRTQQGFQVITQITNPMGGIQRIAYQDQGLRYANNSFLPAAVRNEIIPGNGQPNVVKEYSYSTDRNFTGYPYAGGFTEGADNLYKVNGFYDYWGEERTLDADNAGIERVKNTFNKFHLTTREETQRGTALTTREYTYNELPGAPFAGQPPNLQIPRQVVATFSQAGGPSRSETVTVESDSFGNTSTKTEASGIRFEYDYYPAQGEPGKCPADPSGYFVRYCKQERIVPAGGGQPRVTNVRYTSISRTQGAGYFVLEQTRSSDSGLESTNYYVDDRTKPLLHGRLRSTDENIGGTHTSTEFTYVLDGNNLEQTRVITGHDGTFTSARLTFCTVTQLLLRSWRAGEGSIIFSYDVTGRVVCQTVAPDTGCAATNTYIYHFAGGPGSPAWVEATDAKGGQYATRYDGLGRVVSAAQRMPGGQERPIKELLYDRLGNQAEETVYDQLEGRQLALKTRYEYNEWNALARTIQPDGSVVLSQRDLVANTLVTGVEGLNTTLNIYNIFDKVESVTQVSTSGARVKTLERRYDGFGRCTSVTNVYGHATEYSYDSFDRIAQIRMQPADGSGARTVTLSYASFSSADLPTATAVNGIVLGRRSYDGIGRMISTANGDAAPWRYEYDGQATMPSGSTSPRGIHLTYAYNSDLSALSEVRSPSDGVCRFTHDPVSGQTAVSENDTAQVQNTYDQYGTIKSERVTMGGQTSETAYEFSPAGRPLSFASTRNGAPSQETVTTYDDAGRPMEMSGSGFKENVNYDHFGRVISIAVSLAGVTQETIISYDEFGREAARSFRLQGSVWKTIARSYTQSGQLSQRTTTDGANVLQSRENFVYDAYSRLISFTCEGQRYPVDRQGRKLRSQRFTYDALDNITEVESGFEDGASNISKRSFSSSLPTQLVRIEQTQPAGVYNLTYDADGNLLSDHLGRTFSYDQFGHLSGSAPGGSYSYDADGRLQVQRPAGGLPLQFFYAYDRLAGQQQGETSVTFHGDSTAVHGSSIREGAVSRAEINALDISNSVIDRTDQNRLSSAVLYTPYGDSDLGVGVTPDHLGTRPAIGFNGQHLDALANIYHLGNGRRAYSPELMIFLSPDPLAPFGAGGLNAYAYCGCDPINMVDPTGLDGWSLAKSILGLLAAIILFAVAVVAAVPTGGASLSLLAVLGAAGAAAGFVGATLGVAVAGVEFADEQNGWDRSDTAQKLSIASLSFGFLSMVIGAGTSVAGGVQAGRALGSYSLENARRLGGAVELSGQGRLAIIGQRALTGTTEAVKSFVGIAESDFLTAVGLYSFVTGVKGTVEDTIGLVDYIQQQNASDGSNGGGQGEVLSPETGDGGESRRRGDPYQAALDPTKDLIAGLVSYSEDFNTLTKPVRKSMNSQFYYGEM